MGIFHTLKCLHYLDLSHNQIDRIEDDLLAKTDHLQELNLSNCQLRSLSTRAFKSLAALTSLNLSNNQVATIEEEIAPDVTTMRYKANSKAKVATAKINPFTHLVSLTTLLLGGNKLDEFRFEWLANKCANEYQRVRVSLINTLDLSNNQLSQIGASKGTTLATLRTLNLQGNRLTSAGDLFDFAIPEEIARLNLSNNQLEVLDPEPFGRFDGLAELDISNNSSLTGENVQQIRSALENLGTQIKV